MPGTLFIHFPCGVFDRECNFAQLSRFSKLPDVSVGSRFSYSLNL